MWQLYGPKKISCRKIKNSILQTLVFINLSYFPNFEINTYFWSENYASTPRIVILFAWILITRTPHIEDESIQLQVFVNLDDEVPKYVTLIMSGPYARILELSFNSTWLLVGSWLFCLQNLLCLISFWCMRGGSVEAWT